MSHEQEYFDTLKRIARDYRKADWFMRDGGANAIATYGVSGEEGLQMAYENIQAEAAAAIKGRKRPKL